MRTDITLFRPSDFGPRPAELLPAKHTSAQRLLHDLLSSSLIRHKDWEGLPDTIHEKLRSQADAEELLIHLVEQNLLTAYQAHRITSGTASGLILGNYRVLDRLGAGGMGVVYKAEHLRLPRLVAIKVLPPSADQDPQLLQRFFAEMWAVAQLQHANIVSAFDAGEVSGPDSDSPTAPYYVMEYIPGQDLEKHVRANGPLAVTAACDLIHQVACGLAEAHKQGLIHRDVKPHNVLITSDGQAKLLDFGLARHFGKRMTEPGVLLGTIDYMAPEQIEDPSAVDVRADIYGLGGTLYWSLTGLSPFPTQGSAIQDLVSRLNQPPPSLGALRPEIPAELDALMARMMALNPADRYATPNAVMQALLPFLRPETAYRSSFQDTASSAERGQALAGTCHGQPRIPTILIVDDEAETRALCRLMLESEGIHCAEACNGVLALEACAARPYDLMLLDLDMPEMGGPEVLRRLRESPPWPHFKIVMFSGRASSDEMASMLEAGADDYLTKPPSVVQLRSRVKAALRLKEAQERSDLLNKRLLAVNSVLEQNLNSRDGDLVCARNALVLALAELVAYRDAETGTHLQRLQRYCRCLAKTASEYASFTEQIDENFIQMLECCAPLHDIGKVGLPDHILLKPGKLDADERILMQTHTIIGADTLRKVADHHAFSAAFFQMAIDIARHHHERYDGRGYPDRLMGSAIPLAARIVAVGDVYDALRARRPYKPALSHSAARQVMLEASSGQFDPLLLQAFQRCTLEFEGIFREVQDWK